MVPGVIGEDSERDLATLVVARVGRLEETGSPWEPYRLVDPSGAVVQPAARFLAELQALGRSEATQRSYGNDLLRWFRFLWAIGCRGIRPPGPKRVTTPAGCRPAASRKASAGPRAPASRPPGRRL